VWSFYKRLPAGLKQRFADAGDVEMTWDKERWQNEFEIRDIRTSIVT